MIPPPRLGRRCWIGALAALVAAACATSNDPAPETAGPSSTATGSGGEPILASVGGSGGLGRATSGGGGACASSHTDGQPAPLDIYIMLDRSASMADEGKWQSCTAALEAFLQSADTAGIGVGLGYFGQHVAPLVECASKCTDCVCVLQCGCNGCYCQGTDCSCPNTELCFPGDYAIPAVEIAPLPGSAADLAASLGAMDTFGGTPTRPALEGAIEHAHDWAVAHPGHKVVAVLATDGLPSETVCMPDTLADVEQVAKAGSSAIPAIETFVIGVGPELASLDAIAAAGGTGAAYLVDSSGDTTQQFIDAMSAIRDKAGLPCEYVIPEGANADIGKVNVQYIPANGDPIENVLHASTPADCDVALGGWYYDDNQSPTQIIMCPATCAKIAEDSQGKVDILLGCETVDIPPA